MGKIKSLPKEPGTPLASVNYMEFENSLDAWMGINEYLITKEQLILKRGGAQYGPQMVSYNNFVVIKDIKLDPRFDFGTTLGYSDKKWSSLVNNYCDFNYLDLIRAEVGLRASKKAKSYNYAYHFNNVHGSGKDCLVSLTFTKRPGIDHPIVVFSVRTSEVTHRLLFDFLLVERMVEYVYGKDQKVECHFFAPSFFCVSERVVVYNNMASILDLLSKKIKKNTLGEYQKRILRVFKDFTETHPDKINFRSHKRSAAQIQGDSEGKLSRVKPLYAKQLKLKFREKVKFPEHIISPKQKAKFIKENKPKK
jgi:hypothetical protein